jgi:hypothetical protein
MPPCYGAPRPTRVRPNRGWTGGPPRARRTYGAASGRRVARGKPRRLGRGVDVGKACRPRAACDLRRRGVGPRAGTDSETARARGRSVAARCRGAERRLTQLALLCLSLNMNNSKNLNRSASSDELESCRSNYPLPLSKRPYSVFLNRFCIKGLPTLNANLCQ